MRKFWNVLKGTMYVFTTTIMFGIGCWYIGEWNHYGIDDMELPAIIAGFAIILAALVGVTTMIETVVRKYNIAHKKREERRAQRMADLVLMKIEQKVKEEIEK